MRGRGVPGAQLSGLTWGDQVRGRGKGCDKDGCLGTHDALRGEQINQFGSRGRSVEMRRPWGDAGASPPQSSRGLCPEDKGGPERNGRAG